MISFVIPCYKSANTIGKVVAEIEQAMLKSGRPWEAILVNDCSPDLGETERAIAALTEKYPNIKGILLAKNFGQHAALMAGFQYVSGDIIVCLDDDGQTPADEVEKLLGKIEEGVDVVYAKYEEKKHSFFRNLGSRVNAFMAKTLLQKPKDLYVSSYFAAKRFVIEEIKGYTHAFPYIIGLILRSTNNICNVSVNHRERVDGSSGYTMTKLLSLWFNGFTAFSVKPLRIASMVGFACTAIGILYGLYIIINRILNPNVPAGYSSLMAIVIFIGGMLMLMLGMIGEYIGRIYISINNSPQFVVRKVLSNLKESTPHNEE